MLLFRHFVNITAEGAGDAVMPLIASLYRQRVDAGYQSMVSGYAAVGLFNEYLLKMLEAVLKNGK